jgi:UDP-N-acetylglucosamine--N-acetylmuramyl-(pentapeptide) pyrophosphoryl-undecaprenol N-acetylglucosamine transferase
MSTHRYIISGGGTGGHIFPAIAIADALRERDSGCALLFIGAADRMEMERVPQAGYKIEGLNISGYQRGEIWANLSLPYRVIRSMIRASDIIRSFKPDVVIGVGGYASGPTLFAASLLHIPTIIQEQNSYAGITNKILAKRAVKICTAYEGMEQVFPADKIILTGNPVRASILNKGISKAEAAAFFGLRADVPTLLVIGGSLGARTINRSIDKALSSLANAPIQVIWQTGKGWINDSQLSPNIHRTAFIDRMDYAYTLADVIVSRAGALSIAELQNIGKPVILVPSPNVTDDHQTHNAMALVNKQAAILVRDADATTQLVAKAIQLLNDTQTQSRLRAHIQQMAIPDAATRIAEQIINTIS